ncbi:hypothetical protein DKX38_026949 [Salix brachista]|uniref:Alcohol dehydrogenase-like C-terminal domain-containing protein n=1 Tax=Salix brachista TaxID=2182728 RepID=A0A5N5JAZ2_9ROSI|nr:hypothetical protein DKX38_026949 [Salix brachista]
MFSRISFKSNYHRSGKQCNTIALIFESSVTATQKRSACSLLPSGIETEGKLNDNAAPSPRWLNHSGCALFTAYGAMAYAAQVRPGDSVAVIGVGGVGSRDASQFTQHGSQELSFEGSRVDGEWENDDNLTLNENRGGIKRSNSTSALKALPDKKKVLQQIVVDPLSQSFTAQNLTGVQIMLLRRFQT